MSVRLLNIFAHSNKESNAIELYLKNLSSGRNNVAQLKTKDKIDSLNQFIENLP